MKAGTFARAPLNPNCSVAVVVVCGVHLERPIFFTANETADSIYSLIRKCSKIKTCWAL